MKTRKTTYQKAKANSQRTLVVLALLYGLALSGTSLLHWSHFLAHEFQPPQLILSHNGDHQNYEWEQHSRQTASKAHRVVHLAQDFFDQYEEKPEDQQIPYQINLIILDQHLQTHQAFPLDLFRLGEVSKDHQQISSLRDPFRVPLLRPPKQYS